MKFFILRTILDITYSVNGLYRFGPTQSTAVRTLTVHNAYHICALCKYRCRLCKYVRTLDNLYLNQIDPIVIAPYFLSRWNIYSTILKSCYKILRQNKLIIYQVFAKKYSSQKSLLLGCYTLPPFQAPFPLIFLCLKLNYICL